MPSLPGMEGSSWPAWILWIISVMSTEIPEWASEVEGLWQTTQPSMVRRSPPWPWKSLVPWQFWQVLVCTMSRVMPVDLPSGTKS